MTSKYDFFWCNKLALLSQLLNEAYEKGESRPVDISDIQGYGDRSNWQGIVEVSRETIKKGEMAHAKSLGNVIRQNMLLEPFGDLRCRLTISPRFQLTAKRLDLANAKPIEEQNQRTSPFPATSAEQRLVEILKQVPWPAWEQILKEEPEWYTMLPFLERYGFGSFAVLMLATGLNDYQLRGKAELAYWPPIAQLLSSAAPPATPAQLSQLLKPFYRNERYAETKINRLDKFLSSNLAQMLWDLHPGQISGIFPYIWRELAKTMSQEPQAKTISFAMKCLGLSLLMAEESSFNFSQIPIPVDIRVVRFTQDAGLYTGDSLEQIQAIWSRILTSLQKLYSQLTMIHLDSLVWQIAGMDERQRETYFSRIGAGNAGKNLTAFLHKLPAKPVARAAQQKPRLSGSGKVICFIPCCKSKRATGTIITPERHLGEAELPNTWEYLAETRDKMRYCLDTGSRKTSALMLYTGAFYEAFAAKKNDIADLIKTDRLSLYIISAGYGLLDGLEPALDYDAVLQGKVAALWRNHHLSYVIADLLLKEQPAKVFGFFAGPSAWSSPSSKYRFFFTEGTKIALKKGLNADAGCFYRMEGQGVAAIMGGLGRTFAELTGDDFNDDAIQNIQKHNRKDGGVLIGFAPFTG